MRRSTASAPISSINFCAFSGFCPTRRLRHATTAACFSRSGRGSSSLLFVFLVREVCQEYWGAAILLWCGWRSVGTLSCSARRRRSVPAATCSDFICSKRLPAGSWVRSRGKQGRVLPGSCDMLVPLYASSGHAGSLTRVHPSLRTARPYPSLCRFRKYWAALASYHSPGHSLSSVRLQSGSTAIINDCMHAASEPPIRATIQHAFDSSRARVGEG